MDSHLGRKSPGFGCAGIDAYREVLHRTGGSHRRLSRRHAESRAGALQAGILGGGIGGQSERRFFASRIDPFPDGEDRDSGGLIRRVSYIALMESIEISDDAAAQSIW